MKYLSSQTNIHDLYLDISLQSCIENEAQTIECCVTWLKIINKVIFLDSKKELLRIFMQIKPLLRINDSLQGLRYQLLFGIPQLKFEDMSFHYRLPSFGYHVDERGYIEFMNLYETYETNCLLRKLLCFFRSNDYLVNDFFLHIVDESSVNPSFLKFLCSLPSESLGHKK